jgi:hypothetical protein
VFWILETVLRVWRKSQAHSGTRKQLADFIVDHDAFLMPPRRIADKVRFADNTGVNDHKRIPPRFKYESGTIMAEG